MAYRRFEGVDHTAKYARYRPMWPSHVVERVLSYLEEKLPAPHDRAVDVGCGSGQFTQLLAPHFNHVTGIDVSDNQIQEARKMNQCKNIQYSSGPAETLPLNDHSVDLVTSASAAHWFDLDKFYTEVDRVLKPNGCVALLGYPVRRTAVDANPNGILLTQLLSDFDKLLVDENCWEKGNFISHDGYKDLLFPYSDFVRDDCLTLEYEATLDNFIGYLRSWSGYIKYMEKYPESGILETLRDSMLKTLNMTSSEAKLNVKHNVFILLGRKPGP
ncbi:putative methyltransferase DDB_G0268948 [Lingula anatina]|uniref:Methyltransferase DDB_G0268948 n=1 Tax=Lingula anatina TaxID=7574 RepID=A0A1S3IBS1_LINAN|nr:putative methyltransferase DDB_G0268948 [Lingula anatina]|eukprot:XP_013395692.1 putative methyltransferase DDB_G0268948 [Lingula anatina]